MIKYLLLLLVLCSCATAKKKAIELSENGRHEEALSFWAEALKKDPDDEDIQNGMQASLDFVSNDRLTRIRDKRLANNMQASLEQMKSLVDLQEKYNIKLDFNSSSFQGKEVQYLWPYYKKTISGKIDKKLPLSADSDHRHYHNVFNSMRDYSDVHATITKAGQEKCGFLKKDARTPFYRSFTNQFCKHFSSGRNGLKSDVSSALYSGLKVISEISRVNETVAGVLPTAFEKNMKETPWYHPDANRVIIVKLKGQYDWKPHSEEVQQAHNYKEKVPYTDYETVTKTREIPYDSFVNGVRTTRYRSETYRDKEPVTKYRSVNRVYEYWALKKSLEISLNISGNIGVEKETFPFFFQKNLREEKLLHNMNMPDIGLYPQRDDVSDPMLKFEDIGHAMALQFKNDLNAIWEKKFCSVTSAENVLKCRKLEGHPLHFVDSWFENRFGVTSKRAGELLGQF